MKRPIRSLLIANRGEIAIRIIRTCREMGIRTVAVYSDADAGALHVQMADEALRLGPSPAAESYLQGATIVEAAVRAGVDAIHPGYGFLSERSEFSALVRDAGLIFIGPQPGTITLLGDKLRAREFMRRESIPVLPGSTGPCRGTDEAIAEAHAIGYPVILKAAAGGGGRGMRMVSEASHMAPAFSLASSEAESAFGDGRIFLERFVEGSRHIEIQFAADEHGHAVHFGERECSIQRRHQKVVEESPSVAVNDQQRAAMAASAVRAAAACGYAGVGTAEFILGSDGTFHFLEVNTRLQVEHPITEWRTGCDLVRLQILIAQGDELPVRQQDISWAGHAIECRICAEDARHDFMPSSGHIAMVRRPQGPGVREDSWIEGGTDVTVFYDSLLAKLSVWAPDRLQAIHRMARALEEYEVVGVTTNLPTLRGIMQDEAFGAGTYTTGFLADRRSSLVNESTYADAEEVFAIASAFLEDRGPRRNGAGTGEAAPHATRAESRWTQRGSWK